MGIPHRDTAQETLVWLLDNDLEPQDTHT